MHRVSEGQMLLPHKTEMVAEARQDVCVACRNCTESVDLYT